MPPHNFHQMRAEYACLIHHGVARVTRLHRSLGGGPDGRHAEARLRSRHSVDLGKVILIGDSKVIPVWQLVTRHLVAFDENGILAVAQPDVVDKPDGRQQKAEA